MCLFFTVGDINISELYDMQILSSEYNVVSLGVMLRVII